ncbi:Dnl-Type Zinc Finger Protein [Manis pentadactyla]|nr:Dnl-Type Zinc Finger Protein [Manis pentadactyla]
MADGPMPLLGFTFLQDCEGEMVFRDAALPGEPALLRLQDQTPCRHLSKHRGEKPQRKGRKFIYIYNIKSLGD